MIFFRHVMSYDILLWGNATDIQKINILQKRVVRTIYKLSQRHSVRDKFIEINVITVLSQCVYDNIL